jgi:hypothetical protein
VNIGKYSNTIVAALLGLVGLAIVAFLVLPEGAASTIFGGLIIVVALQLLSVRQQEANGHRLASVERIADENSVRLDDTPGAAATRLTPTQSADLTALPEAELRAEIARRAAKGDPRP